MLAHPIAGQTAHLGAIQPARFTPIDKATREDSIAGTSGGLQVRQAGGIEPDI
jgi:hypothetical protein